MKKLLALLLCILMVVTSAVFMTGCNNEISDADVDVQDSNDDEDDEEKEDKEDREDKDKEDRDDREDREDKQDKDKDKDKEEAHKVSDFDKLVGEWECKVSVDQFGDITEAFAQTPEMEEYFKDISKLSFDIEFIINEDTTCKLALNEQSAKEVYADFRVILSDGMTAYFEDVIEQQNLGLTVEDMLASVEVSSVEELIDTFITEEAFLETIDFGESEGCCYVKDGYIYMSESTEDKVDADNYEDYTGEAYELSGDTLKINELEFVRK